MTINEYIQKAQPVRSSEWLKILPRIECEDGFTMSVQVGDGNYCSPRIMDSPHYDAVEVGFTSEVEPLLMGYADDPDEPTGTVYGYVPCDVVDAVIEKHGGIVEMVQ